MAATITIFDSFCEYLGDGTFDLNSNTFKATLHSSAYNVSTVDQTDTVYVDLGGELPTANGYTNGGKILTGVTWTRVGSTVTFDANDISWSVTTANLVARWCMIRAVGTFNGRVDPIVCAILLDNAPNDIITTPGNSLTVIFNAAGIFTVSRV